MIASSVTLSKTSCESLETKAAKIRALGKTCAVAAVEIGRELIAARTILEAGAFKDRHFTTWIAREFDWSLRSAYRFINLALQFGNLDNAKLANYSLSALYLLAEPSTPESVREESAERVEADEKVTHQEVKSLLRLHRDDEAESEDGWKDAKLRQLEEDVAREDELRRGVASLTVATRRLRESQLVRKPVLLVLEECLTKCQSLLGKMERQHKKASRRVS